MGTEQLSSSRDSKHPRNGPLPAKFFHACKLNLINGYVCQNICFIE